MLQRYKHEIIIALFLIGFTLSFVYLYGLLLPFIIALLLVFGSFPVLERMQKVLKNRNFTISVFLSGIITIVILFSVFLVQYVNRDFQRLNHSFVTLVSDNEEQLDHAGHRVKEAISGLYDFEELADIFENKTDSLVQAVGEESSQLNTESIESALKSILSVFGDDADQKEDQKSRGIGFLTMFFSTIGYFVLILFNYDYFDGIRKKYFGGLVKSRLGVLMDDFDKSFLKYIRLRTRIVLILAVVYTTAFVILDMPGTFLLVIMIVLLSYIPYLQYLVLIPLMIGCLVLSIENGPGFLFYFGITFGVFILATLIEELLLTPRIMEKNIGMNPVIMVLAASLGNFVFGIPGLLIGIPLASLILIYVKRYFLTSYEVISLEEKGKKEK